MLQRRLDHMIYVGLTEEHRTSATMFAKLVGAQVLAQSEALNSTFKQETTNKTEGQKYMEFLYSLTFFAEPNSSFSDSEADGLNQIEGSTNNQNDSEVPSSTHAEPARENVIVL
ncbi:hypothetical protein BHM03_00007017 [Ensete ventricosum]|nr:hypothetical protein BHM03_00007017 [Ensete ventricosum]